MDTTTTRRCYNSPVGCGDSLGWSSSAASGQAAQRQFGPEYDRALRNR
jgi:hypothetical protein